MAKRIFCLMGPTGSGKTQLAMELIQQFPFEIISVDSAMIYREMDIGTAKPSPEELAKAPHHLIDILDPVASYSAAEFCSDVKNIAATIFNKGKMPLLVGGTMMYFKALQQGLSQLPGADEKIRAQIMKEAEERGWAFLHQKLQTLDPKAVEKIHPKDTQRISRALEVYYLTGKSFSENLQKPPVSDYIFSNFALFPGNRVWLHERIAARFEKMLAEGLVEEVVKLLEKWHLTPSMPALRCVGYRQVAEYLKGDYDLLHLSEKGVAATRQLAKRQLTWLRSWPDIFLFDPQDTLCAANIMAKIGEILDNNRFA